MKMSPGSPLCFQKTGHLPSSLLLKGWLQRLPLLPDEPHHFTPFLSSELGLPLGSMSARTGKAPILPPRLPCPP